MLKDHGQDRHVRRYTAALVIVSATAAAFVVAWSWWLGERARSERYERALAFFSSEYPKLVTGTFDGQRVLLKDVRDGRRFLLVVEEPETRRRWVSPEGSSQLLLSFAPDRRTVAFLMDNEGDLRFRLHGWTFDANAAAVQVLDAVEAKSARRYVRWAPGPRLAYFQDSRGGTPQVRVVEWTGTTPRASTACTTSDRVTDLAWSGDARRLAIVDGDTATGLRFRDFAQSTCAWRKITESSPLSLRHVDWCPDREVLLVTAKQKGEAAHRVFEVDYPAMTARELMRWQGDAEYPLCLAGGRGWLIHRTEQGRRRLMLGHPEHPWREMPVPDGDVLVQSVSADRSAALALVSGESTSAALVRIALPGGDVTRVFDHRPENAVVGTNAELATVRSRDGTEVPLVLLRPGTSDGQSRRHLILYIPTDMGPVTPALNMFREYLARQGLHILGVNHRGTSSQGSRRITAAELELQVDDVLAAYRWATERLELSPSHVTIFGSSIATGLAVRAAATLPEDVHALALLSPVQVDPAVVKRKLASHVLLFHAENDTIPLETAERVGALVARNARRARVVQLPGDGHSVRTPRSWATISTSILDIVGQPVR